MTEAMLDFLSAYSYPGVFLLMVLENVFPPIPSEVILPYVGHLAATGELNLFIAMVTAIVGSLFGTSLWFLLGYMIPVERLKVWFSHYGGYIAITKKDFEQAARFFEKYERAAVFFGRMIPAVRSVISIPAGSVRMSIQSFVLISLAGITLWNTILITAGYLVLTDVETVEQYVDPISDLIILAFIAAYVIQVVRFLRNRA